MSWQLLIAISVVTLSLSILLQRVLLHKYKSDPFAYAVLFQGTVAGLILIYALINGFQMPNLEQLWFPALMTVLLFGVGNVVYAKTLQRVEASIFSILFATSALWVMLMGFFLFDERLTFLQLIGVLLVFAGIALIAERSGKFEFSKGIWMGLFTGLLYGLASAAWAYVGRYVDAASWSALSFAGPALVVLLMNPRSIKHMRPFLARAMLLRMALLGLLFSISALTLLQAYSKGNFSQVAPLQQTNIILTILLSIIVLGERQYLFKKALAAIICFAGVLLII